MIEVLPQSEGNMLVVKATGKLTNEDYKQTLIPRMDTIIREYGRARLVMDMSNDFQGWQISAMWDDVRFGVAHRNDLERMAIVGGTKSIEWGAKIAKLWMNGQIKCFPATEFNTALAWAKEYTPEQTTPEIEPELVECGSGY